MVKACLLSFVEECRQTAVNKNIGIVILFIPLLVNILLALVLSGGQIRNIPMAVTDLDQTVLSRTVVQQFRENETFNIRYELEDDNELQKLLNNSKARVGMIIPKGFGSEVNLLKSPSILLIYDGSHMSMASAAKSKASEILMTLKAGIQIRVLEGKLGMTSEEAKDTALGMSFSAKTLYNPTKNFQYFLSPGLFAASVQVGIALMAAVALNGMMWRRRRRECFGQVIGKLAFYTLSGSFSLVFGMLLQTLIFKIPFRGSFTVLLLISLLFSFCVSSFGIMIFTWLKNEMLSTIVNAIVFLPSTVLAGYTWPVLSMPEGYRSLAYFLPFYHYADNIRDILLKESLPSGSIQDMLWLGSFGILFMLAAFAGMSWREVVKTVWKRWKVRKLHSQEDTRKCIT